MKIYYWEDVSSRHYANSYNELQENSGKMSGTCLNARYETFYADKGGKREREREQDIEREKERDERGFFVDL